MFINLFYTLLKMNLITIIIAVIVLLIKFVLEKLGASKKILFCLWAIIALRLVLPVSLKSNLSIFNYLPEFDATSITINTDDNYSRENVEFYSKSQNEILNNNTINETQVSTINTDYLGNIQNYIDNNSTSNLQGAINNGNASNSQDVVNDENNLQKITTNMLSNNLTNSNDTIINIIMVIWLLGSITLILYLIGAYASLKNRLKYAVKNGDYYETDMIPSSCIVGFLKPKIYLTNNLNNDDKKIILEHEKVHIERKDYIIKILAYTILAVHWINPFNWILFKLFAEDIEKICDEEVIKRLGISQRDNYMNALLYFSSNRKKVISAYSIGFNEVSIKKRIKNILSYKEGGVTLSIIAVIAGVLLTSICLTDRFQSPKTGTWTDEEVKKNFYTDEEVRRKFEDASEIYEWFANGVPKEKLDYNYLIISEDGYLPIVDDRFSNLKELRNYLKSLFVDEIANELLNGAIDENLIKEKEGKLYAKEHSSKSLEDYSYTSIDNIWRENDKINIAVSVVLKNGKSGLQDTFYMTFTDGDWKFSKFYLKNYSLFIPSNEEIEKFIDREDVCYYSAKEIFSLISDNYIIDYNNYYTVDEVGEKYGLHESDSLNYYIDTHFVGELKDALLKKIGDKKLYYIYYPNVYRMLYLFEDNKLYPVTIPNKPINIWKEASFASNTLAIFYANGSKLYGDYRVVKTVYNGKGTVTITVQVDVCDNFKNVVDAELYDFKVEFVNGIWKFSTFEAVGCNNLVALYNILNMQNNISTDFSDENLLEENSDLVVVGSLEQFNKIEFVKQENEYNDPYTYATININEILKSNDNFKENDFMEVALYGGIIPYSEYEKILNDEQINRLKEIENIDQTFVKFNSINGFTLEKNREYIFYLKYSDYCKAYTPVSIIYGVKEY